MEEEAQGFFHTADQFVVDDLLVDFSNEDNDVTASDSDGANIVSAVADSSNSSPFSAASLSSFHGDVQAGASCSGELCVPSDELAELEWFSNFVEDSFSTEDAQKLPLIPGYKTRPDPKSEPSPDNISPLFTTDVSVPAKARSKRPRASTCNWASRGLLMEAVYDNLFTGETLLSSHRLPHPTSMIQNKKQAIDGLRRKKDSSPGSAEERRCLHCNTDKTPQWRTGPMGPKTLCNACGVRYKSGRLEYRPAASPTFMLTKVMKLRRKEGGDESPQ